MPSTNRDGPSAHSSEELEKGQRKSEWSLSPDVTKTDILEPDSGDEHGLKTNRVVRKGGQKGGMEVRW